VRGLAFDGANNRLWFVQSDAIVGFADPARVVPDTNAGMVDRLLITPLGGGGTGQTFHGGLQDIAVGAGGLAWFTEANGSNYPPFPGHRIASIDGNLSVTESENLALQGGLVALDGSRYEARPAGITTDPSGKPWFAESDAGNPGWRIATSRGLGYEEYLITPCAGSPCSGSLTGTGPTDVAVAHDGSIWFTNQLRNEVGRLDVAARTFTNYSLTAIDAGLAGGQPRAISVAPDGTLWVAENGGFSLANANAIVKLVPSQPNPTATVFHLGAGKFPLAVAPDTKGNVWFTLATDVAPGLVGRLAGVVGAVPDRGGSAPAPAPGRVVRATSVGVARVGTPSVAPDGRSIRANQVCVGPPRDICSLVYLISTNEYVAGFPGSRASAARRHRKPAKPKPVILGRKLVTLHGGQRKLVTISLNATGRRLLARARGGKLTAYFTATQAGARGKPAKRVKQAKVTFKLPHRHRRR
jgi:streptogramin lyase